MNYLFEKLAHSTEFVAEQVGIGSYECHGYCGYDSRVGYVPRFETVDLRLNNPPKEVRGTHLLPDDSNAELSFTLEKYRDGVATYSVEML